MPGGWLFGGGGRVEYRITLPADARVRVETVNGGIHARYRAASPDGRHRFSTTNGSITVSVPEGAGGRLGKGRGSLELSTVNGSIRLRPS